KGAVGGEAGTKAAGVSVLDAAAGAEAVVRLRLTAEGEAKPDPFAEFEAVLADRRHEADEFYAAVLPAGASDEQRRRSRPADAGLLWGEQVYPHVGPDWVDGDARPPHPPAGRGNPTHPDPPRPLTPDLPAAPRQS